MTRIARAAIATFIVARTPALYESTAMIQVTDTSIAGPDSEALRARLAGALSRGGALRATTVVIRKSADGAMTVTVSHAATDAGIAQHAVAAVVDNLTNGPASLGTLVQPPALPGVATKAHGLGLIPSGAALGFALGACGLLIRRRLAPV